MQIDSILSTGSIYWKPLFWVFHQFSDIIGFYNNITFNKLFLWDRLSRFLKHNKYMTIGITFIVGSPQVHVITTLSSPYQFNLWGNPFLYKKKNKKKLNLVGCKTGIRIKGHIYSSEPTEPNSTNLGWDGP